MLYLHSLIYGYGYLLIKTKKALAQFYGNAVKFLKLFTAAALTDRAEVKGECPATTVVSGQKIALLHGTALLALAPRPLLP